MNFKIFLNLLLLPVVCVTTTFSQDGSTNSISFNDTLIKYKGFDTLIKTKPSFFVGTINSKTFLVTKVRDSIIIIFQKNKKSWFISHTLDIDDIAEVLYSDLNGDNNKDVIVVQDYTAAGGNSENIVLLYNSKAGLFKHNKFYDLPNIKYDKAKKLIYSAWYGSANHPQEKMVYKPSGDSLIFNKGVTYIPDEQTQGEIGTVEFYVERKGKRTVIKTLKGKADKMFRVFDTTFWDTTDQ